MERNELYEISEEMTEIMGTEKLLDQLLAAMSTKEIEENLRFIDRCNDLNLFEEIEQ